MKVSPRAVAKISLVLADVDGTLVTAEKVLTPRATAACSASFKLPLGWAGPWTVSRAPGS